MTRQFAMGFLTVALAAASASEHRVTLFQTSVINGNELKAGEYKVELKDNKAFIRQGKQTVEADVKVEDMDSKFSSTSVRYSTADGKARVSELRLGGTRMKVVFPNAEATQAGGR